MEKSERKQLNTKIDASLLKSLKILSVKRAETIEKLIEDSIVLLLKKHGEKVQK